MPKHMWENNPCKGEQSKQNAGLSPVGKTQRVNSPRHLWHGVEIVPRHERANVVESVPQWESIDVRTHFGIIGEQFNVEIA